MELGGLYRWRLTSSTFFPNYDAKTIIDRQWTLATNCNMQVNDWEPSFRFLYMYTIYEKDRKEKEEAERNRQNAEQNRAARVAQAQRNASKRR